jgi:hypothetical protein
MTTHAIGSRPAAAALTMTRDDVVMRQIGQAVERMRRWEAEAPSVFAEWHAAREAAAERGLMLDLELAPGIDAAYALWKQERARAQGRELEHEDQTVEGWPIK